MPIFTKIIFGAGGPTKVRPTPILVIARTYVLLEDKSDWFITENDEPFILE